MQVTTEADSEMSNDDDAQIKLDTDTVLVTPCTWYSVSVSQYLSGGTNFQLDDVITAFLCLEAKNWTYLEGGEKLNFKLSSIYKHSKNGQPRNKTYDLLQDWTVTSAPFFKGVCIKRYINLLDSKLVSGLWIGVSVSMQRNLRRNFGNTSAQEQRLALSTVFEDN